jgi:hypothetical protein
MAYHAVARHHYDNGVAVVCHTHRPNRLWPANRGGNFLVGSGLAEGYLLQRLPYRFLKFSPPHDKWHGKLFSFTRQVFFNLRRRFAYQGRFGFGKTGERFASKKHSGYRTVLFRDTDSDTMQTIRKNITL